MWERFGFYTMGAMFTLYLQHPEQGFGWARADATGLNANYQMFVYASPLLGGWIADRRLGYRNSVLLGGFIFMIGYLLFTIPAIEAVYAALVCLVIGNGFFKPNVSAMVGHLYPEGSPLKDRAYNIFYMGINVGALLAPLSAAIMQRNFGFRTGFAVASGGMVISVATLWLLRRFVVPPHREHAIESAPAASPATASMPPSRPIDAVPRWKRIAALLVVFVIVIVFWMVFHQNSSTITYWAKDNIDWSPVGLESENNAQVRGIVSNAINPFWVVTLTIPLVSCWRLLARYGKEPSTPTKMAMGMGLLGVSYCWYALASALGEAEAPTGSPYSFRVSLFWLVSAYCLATLGELMLSPMGLSLVSKVAPIELRGVMMGGWFVATAIGNKLTAIGKYWDDWRHSTFFAILAGLSFLMAIVLLVLLKPLKKAMPGV
jgi:POT family proton-dependent oligopeptide transporter